MDNAATVTLQTIQVQLTQIQQTMATKDELNDLRKTMATKDELNDLRKTMATKDDIASINKMMATKDDLAALHISTKNDLLAMEQRLESNNEKLFTAIKEDLDSLQTTTNAILEIVDGQKDDLKDHDLRIHLLEGDMIRVRNHVGIPATAGNA